LYLLEFQIPVSQNFWEGRGRAYFWMFAQNTQITRNARNTRIFVVS
jgi:hypothetical protein